MTGVVPHSEPEEVLEAEVMEFRLVKEDPGDWVNAWLIELHGQFYIASCGRFDISAIFETDPTGRLEGDQVVEVRGCTSIPGLIFVFEEHLREQPHVYFGEGAWEDVQEFLRRFMQ